MKEQIKNFIITTIFFFFFGGGGGGAGDGEKIKSFLFSLLF